jgi:endonuclease V-like protein UPF0215 family
MSIRLEKKAIRALGIAESFRIGQMEKSILAGVVMRSDLIVDGFVFGSTTLGGNDATESILEIFEELDRNDINIIILRGVIISFFNIIDLDEVYQNTNVPVIGVTFEESEGLEPHFKHHFPNSWKSKLELYNKIGSRVKIVLKTGYSVFTHVSGLTENETVRTLDKFTVQGAIPEPIRLAQLLAKAKLSWDTHKM